MKILLYRWKVFNQDDVKSAIEYFGHEVHDYTETVIDKDDETGFKLRDYAELRQVFDHQADAGRTRLATGQTAGICYRFAAKRGERKRWIG